MKNYTVPNCLTFCAKYAILVLESFTTTKGKVMNDALRKLTYEQKGRSADQITGLLIPVKVADLEVFISGIAAMRVTDLISLHNAVKNLECITESDRREVMADVRNQLPARQDMIM